MYICSHIHWCAFEYYPPSKGASSLPPDYLVRSLPPPRHHPT